MSKQILITGSTDGIGKLAAIRLAAEGCRIFMHGRNQAKLDQAVQEVQGASGSEKVSGLLADLSDLKQVQDLAKNLKKQTDSLDVLLNNAGVFHSPVAKSQYGIDLRLVVNYLAPKVLTEALLPLLKESSDPRIVNLSSAAQAPVSLNALHGKEELDVREAYAQSKLALTMWSFDLAQQETGITITAVNPGSLLNTKMVQEAFGQFWAGAEKGANVLHDLAVTDLLSGKSGSYFDNDLGNPRGDFGRAHADAYDAQKIQALLATTDEVLTGIVGA